MRFAAQRFRTPHQSMGRFTAEDGAEGDYKYRYQPSGLPQSRAAMPEVNSKSMSKSEEPAFVGYNGVHPDFKA